MCGVFGFVVPVDRNCPSALVEKAVSHLARAAESRGKDSSGLVLQHTGQNKMRVFKGNLRITKLLDSPEVVGAFREVAKGAGSSQAGTIVAMGHSRLVTNGSQLQDDNNQPVLKDGVIAIHNGIITNDDAIWARHPALAREYEIDTEALVALVAEGLRLGCTIAQAVSRASQELVGTFSIAMLFERVAKLALASNNCSLYFLTNQRDFLAFASEEWPLKTLRRVLPRRMQAGTTVTQVTPHCCVVVSLKEFSVEVDRGGAGEATQPEAQPCFGGSDGPEEPEAVTIHQSVVAGRHPRQELVLDTAMLACAPAALAESKLLEYPIGPIQHIRRCARCVLPETFPFISFDDKGVCNYCHGYRLKNQPRPFDELMAMVAPYRRKDGKPDCIVPFSGGRDSTYGLHVVKEELRLNPIAFTYDWGMVTDLARRNIARVCGKLNVENIIVSADIFRKRDNIRRNIVAWLRRPVLGMVPLFMAGDKYFYYYTARVGQQTGIKLNIWGINPLENTDFKVGFLGVPPDFDKKHIYSLSVSRKSRLLSGVLREFIRNPTYLNRSVVDSIGGFVSRSIMPHTDYHHLYDFRRWDETEIEKILFDVYDWERACDTETTWRIGDGTAAFYNYIYYTVAGFSEHDTFRSNQIREGQLSRSDALTLVDRDNQPRYPTIKWYLEILGLDYGSTIRRVNSIPKLY